MATGSGNGEATKLAAPSLPVLGKALPPSVKNLSHSINSESSPTDSLRCFLILVTISRKRSEVAKSASVISSLSARAPSRILLSKDSPEWATFSRR